MGNQSSDFKLRVEQADTRHLVKQWFANQIALYRQDFAADHSFITSSLPEADAHRDDVSWCKTCLSAFRSVKVC
jgi:hypothetical protein